MKIFQLAKSRKTSRKYKKHPVNEEDVKYILETIRQSPSGSNPQPWEVIVIDNQRMKAKVRKAAEIGEQRFYESISPEKQYFNFRFIGYNFTSKCLNH